MSDIRRPDSIFQLNTRLRKWAKHKVEMISLYLSAYFH